MVLRARSTATSTAHPGEVVGRDVVAHAVRAHDPGRERRRRVERADVDDQHVDVAGAQAEARVPGEQLRHGAVEEGVHLVEAVLVVGLCSRPAMTVRGGVGVLAEARAEEEAAEGHAEPLVAVIRGAEHLRGHLAVVRRLVADVVQEVAPRALATGGGRHGQVGGHHEEWHQEQSDQLHL
jgi:hypothetical protein